MVTKSILTVRQVYPPSFAPLIRSTTDYSGKSNRIGQDTHFSNDQGETGKQSSKSIAIVDDEEELCSLFSMIGQESRISCGVCCL